MTLTTPPAVRPNSAGAPLAITWNSFTASSVMSMGARCPPACSPKKPLLKSPPSRLMLLKTPRWPANVISSPSAPCTMLTPGVSVSRSSNLRPRIGVDLDRRLIQRCRDGRASRLDDRRAAHGHGFRHVADSQPRREIDGLPDGQGDVVLNDGAEARQAERGGISAGLQLQEHKPPIVIGRTGSARSWSRGWRP